MPADHNSEDHPSREIVLREGSKFSLDLRTIVLLISGTVAIAGSWAEQKYALKSARYEIQAEITRVETESAHRTATIETRLTQIQATNCAIAKTLKVLTAECGRFEP